MNELQELLNFINTHLIMYNMGKNFNEWETINKNEMMIIALKSRKKLKTGKYLTIDKDFCKMENLCKESEKQHKYPYMTFKTGITVTDKNTDETFNEDLTFLVIGNKKNNDLYIIIEKNIIFPKIAVEIVQNVISDTVREIMFNNLTGKDIK